MRTPSEFREFVRDAIEWQRTHPDMGVTGRPILLIEAWNEIGEGGYFVPTLGDGDRYGRALAQALDVVICCSIEATPYQIAGLLAVGVVLAAVSLARCRRRPRIPARG